MFDPQDPQYDARVRETFAAQRIMLTFGARLVRVAPGETDIELPYREDLGQQDGFLHAGVITTVVDSACGSAALSLMPAGARVLSIEFKVNLLSPAKGKLFVARGRVVKPGKNITVCTGDFVTQEGTKLLAIMVATMMCVR
ncbi:MAG: PaaI family thioesterase [Myxococcales bacterium]